MLNVLKSLFKKEEKCCGGKCCGESKPKVKAKAKSKKSKTKPKSKK